MLRFDSIEHRYYWGDVEIPGVSRLLEPLKEPFVAPMAVIEKARRRGEAVHLMTHQHDTGQHVDTLSLDADIYDTAMRMFDAYVKWVKGKEVKESEMMVCCNSCGESPKYAGQLDKAYIIDEVESIYDIKCTAGMYDTHGLQVFMYHLAYYGASWESATPPHILRLSKEGKAFDWQLKKEEMQRFHKITQMLITKYWYWDIYTDRRGLIKRGK